jgi:molecular chaperone DnaK (HSP70)
MRLDEQAGTGEVHILSDAHDKRIIPSVVSYTANAEPVVGYAAKALAATNPKNTV